MKEGIDVANEDRMRLLGVALTLRSRQDNETVVRQVESAHSKMQHRIPDHLTSQERVVITAQASNHRLSGELFLEQIIGKVTLTGAVMIPLPDVVAY